MSAILSRGRWVNSFRPGDPAPTYNLNQYWLIVSSTIGNLLIQWQLNEDKHFFNYNVFENVICELMTILAWPVGVETLPEAMLN